MNLSPDSSIVVLTGAGISAESGLSTFRGAGGLWEHHRFEDLASPGGFARNPGLVHQFYNQRRAQLAQVQPNAAHFALADLARAWPGGLLLVTQNVDDLHERAGSVDVVHMHGELGKVRCTRCGVVSTWAGDVSPATPCPACAEVAALRPHIVWFGEQPFELDRIRRALERCGLFVAVGTSGSVYPAAGFVLRVQPAAHSLELNLEPSEGADRFREQRTGRATEQVPKLVRELLAGLRPA